MRSTGLVLAAGGVAIANEVIFAPLAKNDPTSGNPASVAGFAGDALAGFNWRIIPSTLVLAFVLGGLEKIAPGYAVALGGLALGAVLLIPVGNAPTPLENVSKALGY